MLIKTNKMATVERFDDLLFAILQNCEQIEPFLEVIFSFLARRTDYFRVMHNNTDKMGFPPGEAEKMLRKVFKKYQSIVLQSEASIPQLGKKNTSHKIAQTSNDGQSLDTKTDEPPPAISTVDVQTSIVPEKASSEERQGSSDNTESKSTTVQSSMTDSFNGAVLENYTWSQTGGEVDVRVPVTSNILKGKNVLVEIKDSYLKVALKNTPDPTVLVEGELQWKVHADESMWTLIPGEHIHVSLDKVEDRWWTCVIKGDREIDKSKIDTTRDISEFDEQTQTDYERVMFDHQQKMLGKATSQEKKTHEMLQKAWNAPNSPFAGMPFDPSKVNISGDFS